MVSLKKKIINGREYLYAEHSFRVSPDKSVKISKLIKKPEDANKLKEFFISKEKEYCIKLALSKYKHNSIFTEELIKTVEEIKVEYKYLIKKSTKKQFSDILDRFTINFTYETNAIEGNSLTLKDVTLVLHENIVPKGKDLREVYETKNTRKAADLLFAKKFKINEQSIIRLHKILVNDTGVSSGYKKLPNYLLMRNVKTTPPEKVKSEMDSLIKWYASNKKKLHPLKLAADFHGRFEKIHPFEDGNGRVGRALVNIILLENGYSPLIIRKTERLAYFNALGAFDNGYSGKLEHFLIKKFKDTFRKFFKVYFEYLKMTNKVNFRRSK
ncbi:MAG: Fic family protein [Candidatus Nanoarchaeia archaeon]|nr:Fic family protein [Candidatus Nanoarchaeia archaeon]